MCDGYTTGFRFVQRWSLLRKQYLLPHIRAVFLRRIEQVLRDEHGCCECMWTEQLHGVRADYGRGRWRKRFLPTWHLSSVSGWPLRASNSFVVSER